MLNLKSIQSIRFILIIIGGLMLAGIDPEPAGANRTEPRRLPINRPELITSQTDPVLSFDVSPDGKQLVYAAGTQNRANLWLRSLESGEISMPKRLTDTPASESFPVFFPDGKSIAYIGTLHDVKGDIYLLNIPSSGALSTSQHPERLTGRGTEDGSPCVSPDGRVLYFHQIQSSQNNRQIVSLNLDVRPLQPMVVNTGRNSAFPSISPDGKKLAFVSYEADPNGDILMLNLENGRITELTHGSFMDVFPSWTPDSRCVVFSRIAIDTDRDGTLTPSDNSAIYHVCIEDAFAYPLTSYAYSAFQPKVVGSRLFFLSNEGGIVNCRALPLEGEIKTAETAEVQLQFAEEIAGSVPYNPYLTLTAYYKVLIRNHAEVKAKAAYQIAKMYQQLGIPESADEMYGMTGGVQPWHSLAAIERTALRAKRTFISLIHESQRSEVMNKAFSDIDQIPSDSFPVIEARKQIEKARLLADVEKTSAGLLKALTLLDSVIREHPGMPEGAEAMMLKADIYGRISRIQEVLPIYLAVLKTYPDVTPWADDAIEKILDLNVSQAESSNVETKIQLLRRIADENREVHPMLAAGALNRVGDLYFAANEWGNAKNAYQQVLKQFPVLSVQTTAARLSLAEILYREERFRQALDLYETEISSRPYEDRIYQLAKAGYIRKSVGAGEYLYRIGEIPSAKKTFKELMDYDDAIVEAHRGYIQCAAALNDIPDVLSIYNARLAQKPDDPIALYGKALCLTYLEDKASLGQARTLLNQAISLNGRIEYFYQTLGYVLEVLETVHQEKALLESALESYQKAWLLNDHLNNPDNAAHLLLNLGNIHYALGQFGKAFEYYTQRLESNKPFDNNPAEILFYTRLGSSAFQLGETQQTVAAFTKSLELINARMNPTQASSVLDKIVEKGQQLLRGRTTESEIKALAKVQADIRGRLANLTSTASLPPSPEWTAYKQGMEALLAEQETLNIKLMALAEPNQKKELDQTLKSLSLNVREALTFSEQLVQLKAEMTDRLGLAYQEAGDYEKAVQTFKHAFTLNQQLGLNQNLARNQRSVAYNEYRLAEHLTGEARQNLLQSSADGFAQVIELVKQYGVPSRGKTEVRPKKGLIKVSTQVSIDEAVSTQAAHGFTSEQEIRLAEAFISRIRIELGELAPAEKAIQDQLAHYPPDAKVTDKDRYGVSLLYHRAGLMAAARKRYEDAYRYFRRSAELCFQMQNPVSAAINVANMGYGLTKNLQSRFRHPEWAELESWDQKATQLFSTHGAGVDPYVIAGYHHQMGVYFSRIGGKKQKTENREQRIENDVVTVRGLQQAVFHFTKGIELLEKDKKRQNRQSLVLLAALYLNLARVGEMLGDSGKNFYEVAADLSEQAMVPDLKWRALVGLHRLDQAIESLESVTILRAGCDPGEITGAFSEQVAEMLHNGQTEAAFNLMERLSELERFNRTAFLLNQLPEPEQKLYQTIVPRLERIQELRQKLRVLTTKKGQQVEERRYLQDNLNREMELLDAAIGKDRQHLSAPIRLIPNPQEQEQVMMLIGIAAQAEAAATEHLKTQKEEPSEAYQRLIKTYQAIRNHWISQRLPDTPADMVSFLGPEPVEAIDVMENLPKDSILIRLVNTGDSFMAVTVTPNAINASNLPRMDNIPTTAGTQTYIAYEKPDASFQLPHSFSATHLIRSIKSQKPFKHSVLNIPPIPKNFDALYGIHTLILSAPVSLWDSVPTRGGEYPEHLIGVETENGSRIRIENLLSYASDVSLGILPNTSSDHAYLIGHLFSIYGCPTVIQSQNYHEFLSSYPNHTAWEAFHQSQPEDRFFGFVGMTPQESETAAQNKFNDYVTNSTSAFEAHQYDKAFGWSEKAIYVAKTSKQFEPYLADLYRLARESAYKAGKLDNALKYAEALVDLMSNQQPDSEPHAEALLRAGLVHAKLEHYDKSVPMLEQAVDMLANLELGESQIAALSDLGVVLENAAEYDRALGSFQTAADLSRTLNQQELLAEQYSGIGRIYDLRMSQYATAIQYYQKALAIYRQLKHPNGTAQSLLDIGRCYRLLGNLIEAEQYYQDALSQGASETLFPKILIEQANNAWYQARYQDAFNLQRKVWQIANEKDLALMKMVALNTSGLIWWTLGDQPKALEELHQAMEAATAFKTRKDEIATTWNNIGVVYREMKRYTEALEAFDKALEMDTKLQSRWGMAYDLRNKAQTLLVMGRADESIPLFVQASQEARAIGNRINEAKAMLGLGDAYWAVGKHTEARTAYQMALESSQSMRLREVEWRAVYGMARLTLASRFASAERDGLTAESLLREAISIIETMRAEIKIEQLRDSFVVNKLEVYEMLVTVLADKGNIQEAFEIAERSRARNFIDLLGNQRLSLSAMADQQLYERQKVLKARIEEHEALVAQSKESQERTVYQNALDRLQHELKDLMLDIQAQNPSLASIVSVEPLRAEQVMKTLEPGVALLAYYVVPKEIVCWVIRSDRIQLFRTPVSRETVNQVIWDYRRRIQNLEPFEEASAQLFQWLITPVLPLLNGVNMLGIIPHGTLHYLSFATLSDAQAFLIDRYPIFYVPSASIIDVTFKRRTQSIRSQMSVLAIGNPDLNDPALELPFAEHEVGSLKWNFPHMTMLTREKATESWVTQHIGKFDIIHIASHGEFNPINPLFSAIKLRKDEQADGRLEAAEVLGLRINADMVVLSACQTGLAKITGGDDVVGLNRSFFFAGTHTIISSLWRVSDISTAMLIKHFYREYTQGAKAQSLRRALLHVKTLYPHPGYWGAFTLAGDYE